MVLSPNIKLENISTQEIENIIQSLHGENSHRYDEISMKVLKFSPPFISSPINYICNIVLSRGTFPSCFTFLEIKTATQWEDIKHMTNYRPILLLTSFSKIFEKDIYAKNLVLEQKCQQN